MAAMKRAATRTPLRRPRNAERPKAGDLFAWATGRNQEPTVADAARHFNCRQSDIEDSVDAFDNGEGVPGAYLGLAVALKVGMGVCELKGGNRLIEAYYVPDA